MQVYQPQADPDGWRAHDAAVLGHLLDRILLNLQTLTCAIHSLLHISTISRVLANITLTASWYIHAAKIFRSYSRGQTWTWYCFAYLAENHIVPEPETKKFEICNANQVAHSQLIWKSSSVLLYFFYSFLLKDSKAHDPIFTSWKLLS